MLSSHWLGTLVTLLPWGFLTDRIGERMVLATGLGTCGLLLVVAGRAETFWQLYALLFLAGAAGASVNAATGRAVMGWFDASQRGLALGIRQAAVPSAGSSVRSPCRSSPCTTRMRSWVACACSAPPPERSSCASRARSRVEVADVEWTLRDHRLWRLCSVAGLYVVAQMAILSFVTLYLHDERSLSKGHAAAVLGAVQVAAMVMRVGAGQWSDKLGTRIVPLARIGIAMSVALAVVTGLLNAPLLLLVPAFVVAGSLTMAWNGVAFAAVAELAGRARSGSALGVQQTVLSLLGSRHLLPSRRSFRPALEPRLRARGRCSRSRAGSCSARCRHRGGEAGMRLLERLDELAALGDRIGYSPEEDAAHELAASWFREAGLEVEVDAAGNLIGRIPGGDREVWTGSHLDTVPGAGRFDGTLGVVAGLEAVEALGLPGLAVVVFRDEERGCAGAARVSRAASCPTRTSSCTSSRARAPPRRRAARRRHRDRRLRPRPPELHG